MNKSVFSEGLFAWLLVIAVFSVLNVYQVLADEGHHMGHQAEVPSHNEMNQGVDHDMSHEPEHQMDHSQHNLGNLPKNFEKPSQGVKEVKIDLKGPFCQKHPEEIRDALMKLSGVQAVEAFNGRKYIVIQYTGDETTPEQMGMTVSGLKGSGWRCSAVLSSH